MTASISGDAAPPGAAEAVADTCALCGLVPAADEPDLLRQLGSPPVTVAVCADSAGCVTRYFAR
jgi:hypothetical protein